MYFGMSASAPYLEATVTAAAVAREHRDLEVFVNISQLTVSQMSLTEMTDSPQQRQHWLGEQVLNWTGLPVVHVRPTVFLQNPFFSDWAAESIAKDCTIRLPFGTGRTSPVDARDVAEVIAVILANPTAHIGKVYELTGPRSQDMRGVAGEFSNALSRTITYVGWQCSSSCKRNTGLGSTTCRKTSKDRGSPTSCRQLPSSISRSCRRSIRRAATAATDTGGPIPRSRRDRISEPDPHNSLPHLALARTATARWQSVDPRIGTTRGIRWCLDITTLFGTRSA